MNLICKLFGHEMERETQFTDKSDRRHGDGFLSHTRIHTVYHCLKCNLINSSSVNIGKYQVKDE